MSKSNKAKLRLIAEVEYELNGTSPDVLTNKLIDLVYAADDAGTITGSNTSATCGVSAVKVVNLSENETTIPGSDRTG